MTQEICSLCPRPAAGYIADFPLCQSCFNALNSPDDICFNCNEPLTDEDLAAGETLCKPCRDAPAAEVLEDWGEDPEKG